MNDQTFRVGTRSRWKLTGIPCMCLLHPSHGKTIGHGPDAEQFTRPPTPLLFLLLCFFAYVCMHMVVHQYCPTLQ